MKEMSCLNSIHFIQPVCVYFLYYELQHFKFDNILAQILNIQQHFIHYLPNLDFHQINSMRNLKREFSQFLYKRPVTKKIRHFLNVRNQKTELDN